ncbi:MAG: riboflavin biosynthesis protein RibF [candidate division Zixibacteria bacterium]|nr:riboflavin biosynthesis protein RibF [candidate division Zixibacteria bacterium]
MEVIHNITEPGFKYPRPTTLTIGNFDGVHKGHISLIHRILEKSRKENTAPVLITFDPHPLTVVNPSKTPSLLSTTDEKLRILETFKVPVVVLIHFNDEISGQSADWFLNDILIKSLDARHIIIGSNHAFGKDRKGNVSYLREVLPHKNIELEVVESIHESGQMVSSSEVRDAVAGNDFESAIEMLGHPYPIFGKIISGSGVGKTMGYPTINLEVSERKLLPPHGVYACKIDFTRETVGGMLYVGTRPTFGGYKDVVEISCFCSLDIEPGEYLEAYALKYFRADIKFESRDLLISQIKRDEQTISAYLKESKIKLTI